MKRGRNKTKRDGRKPNNAAAKSSLELVDSRIVELLSKQPN